MIDPINQGQFITKDRLKDLLTLMNMDNSNDNLDVLLQGNTQITSQELFQILDKCMLNQETIFD